MRKLYQYYYQQEKRGFTEAEIQLVCEQIAGTNLSELFEYKFSGRDLPELGRLTYRIEIENL